MNRGDVLIIGGGPAGSSCAWRLHQAGLDAIVVDAATFPRDKPCAGWITPAVIDELQIDVEEYRRGRVWQPIRGFRVGMIGEERTCTVRYRHPVSYAIRRCEFDHYLLTRSAARLSSGTRTRSIRRADRRWIVNDTFEAPMLVGAGGHWCPVARLLNPGFRADALVAAREFECPLGTRAGECGVDPEIVDIYFTRDLSGYGWCVRKAGYVNVGFGAYGSAAIQSSAAQFVDSLVRAGRIPRGLAYRWRGHAYLTRPRPTVVADGALLAGDAVGLADSRSGEGIRPAVESGLLAGSVIAAVAGEYAVSRFAPYAARLRSEAVAAPSLWAKIGDRLPQSIATRVALGALRVPWFVRRVVLDRWFLHRDQPAIADWGLRIADSLQIAN